MDVGDVGVVLTEDIASPAQVLIQKYRGLFNYKPPGTLQEGIQRGVFRSDV